MSKKFQLEWRLNALPMAVGCLLVALTFVPVLLKLGGSHSQIFNLIRSVYTFGWMLMFLAIIMHAVRYVIWGLANNDNNNKLGRELANDCAAMSKFMLCLLLAMLVSAVLIFIVQGLSVGTRLYSVTASGIALEDLGLIGMSTACIKLWEGVIRGQSWDDWWKWDPLPEPPDDDPGGDEKPTPPLPDWVGDCFYNPWASLPKEKSPLIKV